MAAVGFKGKRLEIPRDVNPEVAAIIEACWAKWVFIQLKYISSELGMFRVYIMARRFSTCKSEIIPMFRLLYQNKSNEFGQIYAPFTANYIPLCQSVLFVQRHFHYFYLNAHFIGFNFSTREFLDKPLFSVKS